MPIGAFISAYKEQQDIVERLYEARARMQMYGEGTPHKHGPNPRREANADNKINELGSKIDDLGKKLCECILLF